MNSNVEIISKEIIKPSSKTPDYLRVFHLSCFDQFAPRIYVPIIFFYESRGLITSNQAHISQNLKKSLSETLTSFYPLAGRVDDNGTTVDCNDAGAEFIDARVHSRLTELIQEPDVEQLKKLLPLDPATAGCPDQRGLLLLQLNFFECGGIAVGICFSHQIADTTSIMTFVSAWTKAHVGQLQTFQPNFQLGRYFPARKIWSSKIEETLTPDKSLGTKMLVFTKEKLATLRRAAISSTTSTIQDPTRVELVSTFIWRHISHFFKDNPKQAGSFGAYLAVNMRARVGQKHPVLGNVFGNFLLAAFVLPENDNSESHESVRKFRSAIRSIDSNMIMDKGSLDRLANDVSNSFSSMGIEWFLVTSWCRFPMYEVDFGWGRPIWVCTSSGGKKNGMVLIDTRDGEGIEVWLTNMDKDIIRILEKQIQLI